MDHDNIAPAPGPAPGIAYTLDDLRAAAEAEAALRRAAPRGWKWPPRWAAVARLNAVQRWFASRGYGRPGESRDAMTDRLLLGKD